MLYAHASRVLHLETNPGNARALVQRHGDRDVWINPPPIPLTTPEMDRLYELPYTRRPHPAYGDAKIPAYEMIRFSVSIQRGCFGGCTFCSITEHEGRIIQNRSEASVIREIETIRDTVPGFTGVISDLGGPTANMYRIACKSREIESACRRPSCVYPGICSNLNTDHSALVSLYRRARSLPGVKKVLIASGVRYDLAIESPEYVQELVTHHVGGYLKIAPEHTESGPLSKMMKPGIGAYDRFKELFEKFSKQAGKEQYLIPYFIAAHPGTTDEDMLKLALWLKQNGFRADQVQTFLPSPMATATAMYHSGKNPLRKVTRTSEGVAIPKGLRVRRLHKAFLRYHDPANWPTLRVALRRMGRDDLIGSAKHQLVPMWQPAGFVQPAKPWHRDVAPSARGERSFGNGRRAAGMNDVTLGAMPPSPKELRHGSRQLPHAVPRDAKPARGKRFLTQHTGLPPQKNNPALRRDARASAATPSATAPAAVPDAALPPPSLESPGVALGGGSRRRPTSPSLGSYLLHPCSRRRHTERRLRRRRNLPDAARTAVMPKPEQRDGRIPVRLQRDPDERSVRLRARPACGAARRTGRRLRRQHRTRTLPATVRDS